MVIIHRDTVDFQLLKRICDDGFHAPTSEDIHSKCKTYLVVDMFSKSSKDKIKYKTRKGWTITLESRNKNTFCINNFASVRNDGSGDAVWARQQDLESYIIGASSVNTFNEFLDDHYDVVAYYYASLVPGACLNAFMP
jgi:hypothetical protein